jgi:hypothetical protein
MRRYLVLSSIVEFSILILAGLSPAAAQCVLPYQLTNGQTADATQVMANFNALASCFGSQGATNSVQYNAGGGAFAGVGPLTNGQLVVGSTGAAPQAQTLSAGAGIAITNGAGSITIAATGGQGGTGLYRQVMSATPTSASTGLTNWLNQGSATVSDSAVGLNITAPSSGSSANASARFMAAPSTPYTITALIAATRDSNNYSGVGIGWYDGSNKLHLLSYIIQGGGAPFLEVEKWNSATSWNSNDYGTNKNAFSQPIWLRIRDDGSNVSFAFSQDGANFLQIFTVAKASGWLGASGYSNVIFFVNPQGGQTLGTLMSWTQG